jgi:hypothetical protein
MVMLQLMKHLSKYVASTKVFLEFVQVEAFTKFNHIVVEVKTKRLFCWALVQYGFQKGLSYSNFS